MQSGEALEIQVRRMLELEIKEGKLGLASGNTQIFHRKAYFSKDRGSHIIFDVVIEVHHQDASDPWLVWVFECKDERRPTPIEEVEEFAMKLQQIGVHGVKGTIASRNGFQKSAIEFAKSKRIGLWRQLPDGSITHLLQTIRTVNNESVLLGLTDPDTRNLCSMTYGLTSSGVSVDRFHDFVQIELKKGC